MEPACARRAGPLHVSSGVPPSGQTPLLCGQGFGGVTVVVLPFDRRQVFEHGAELAAVVPGFDPVTDSRAGFGAGAEHPPVDEFFLQGGQERLGRGVVGPVESFV